MKTNQFFAAIVVMMGFTMSAMAQSNNTATDKISAKAEVVAAVTVTKVQDLIFGMVTPGITKTILSDGAISTGATAGNSTGIVTATYLGGTTGAEQAGEFSITKGLNTSITLAFSLPSTLSDGSSHTLPINFLDVTTGLAKLSKKSGSQADVAFTPATGITTAQAGTASEYFTGNDLYVFIGGTVVPAIDQVAGVYSGDITLTATYN